MNHNLIVNTISRHLYF